MTIHDDAVPHFHGRCMTQAQVSQLHEAMLLIAGVADAMDSRSVECQACGAKKKVNWPSHQLKMKLTGVHAKLANLLNSEWYHRKEDE